MHIRTFLLYFIAFLVIFIYVGIIATEKNALAQQFPLSQHSISLAKRSEDSYVNNVFRENILLTIAYMTGSVRKASDIDWQNINKPSHRSLVLRPGEVFAFHDGVLSTYRNKKIITTNAHFGGSEGFLSDGYLYGDGVCHLASLMYWAAKDAGLSTLAPVNHAFANIPGVSREYGVSIFSPNQQQNLYIENNFDEPVVFTFDYNNDLLSLTISFSRVAL